MSSRTTLQIQIAVKENQADITTEELRLCIEALGSIKQFYERALVELVDAIRDDHKLLKAKAEFAWGTHERMFDAQKKPPAEWLGPHNIPWSPEHAARLRWAKAVYKKATGETLD